MDNLTNNNDKNNKPQSKKLFDSFTTKKGKGGIVEWSIDHPYIIISFYLGITILSILAIFYSMPRRLMPYIESPLIGVVSMMPGLSAEEMEIYISKPIEEQLVNVKDLHYIRSTSQDGFSIVSLEFYYGVDMKKSLFDVQALMNVIQANLPATGANLKPSWVVAIDPLNVPVLSLSLTGNGWDKRHLREFADNEVVNRLKVIPDVYSIVPFGGYRRQMQVIVDRNKLAAYGLSILNVKNAIDKYNVSRAGGTLTSGSNEAIVRVNTRALTAKDILNYPIASVGGSGSSGNLGKSGVENSGMGGGMGGGSGEASMQPTTLQSSTDFLNHPRIIYVRDVAKVLDTFWERRSGYHYMYKGKTKRAIEVSIVQNPDASSAKVVPAVMKVLKDLEKENKGIKFEVAYNNSHFVNILFENMIHELLMAILLTGIAVLFFLGEWRGTLISVITIPTSLAMAILAIIPFGFTLNSGTLIGLLLSIGRLVDDSIIDIHSIERHIRMGKNVRQAVIDGVTEVRLAVIASTIVIALALLPLIFSGGIVQLMFAQLVWPIIFGLLASMLVSFTLTPLLAVSLLRTEEDREKEKNILFYRIFLNPFQNFLERLEKGYSKLIAWLLDNRLITLTVMLSTIIIGLVFYQFIGSEMMPLADIGQAFGIIEMQPGTSFAQTEKAVFQLEKIIAKYRQVEKVSMEIGAETMFESFSPFYTGYAMPSVSAAVFMLTLNDKSERKKTIWDVMDGIVKKAKKTIPGIRRLQIKEMGSDVMATSAAPIQLIVFGKKLNMLDRIGKETEKIASEMPGMYQTATSWTMGNPDYEIKVNPQRAQEVGLSADEIAQQTYYSMRGGLTNEFYRLPNIRQNTILVRYDEPFRKNPKDLAEMFITTKDGRQVPLKTVASITYRKAPTIVEHDGLRRVNTIMGFYRKGGPVSMDLSMDLQMKAMQKINFPPGYGIEMRGDMTQMMDSFRRLIMGLELAVLFIFLVLVAQFRGFLQPLQMMFSLPLELSGVFIGLFLAHQAFSTVSIMAVIVLTGMDITTAILLIDLIIKYRSKGVPRNKAVMDACPQRLNPILMTSIIYLIVMIPVAFFPKTGIDAYSPLATVMIGGLTVGTILSLFVIPIMHTYVDDFVKIMNKKFLKREWEWPVIQEEEND